MSNYYGDYQVGAVVRVAFNTVNASAAFTPLSGGTVKIQKDGVDVSPGGTGAVVLTAGEDSLPGVNELVINMSVDTTTFSAGHDYRAFLSTGSNVGGSPVVGAILAEWSVANRKFPQDLTQAVPTTGNTANTVGDCLNAARAQGFGKWVQSGTTLTLYAPDNTTVVRTFTLDTATTPTTRS